MLLTHSRQYVTSLTAWWPTEMADVLSLMHESPFLRLMQIDDALAGLLAPYTFREKPFHTCLVDLSKSPDVLWRALDKKSCRYEINKADRVEHEIVLNARQEAAYVLINDFIRRSRYRKPLSRDEWSASLRHADVFIAFHADVAIVAHIVLVDPPARARLLFSATADRTDERFHAVVGPLNKRLHWHEINDYRNRGFAHYDFGGIVLDPTSALYSISQTKRGFGGEVRTERIVHVTRHPTVKQLAKVALSARHAIRRLRNAGA